MKDIRTSNRFPLILSILLLLGCFIFSCNHHDSHQAEFVETSSCFRLDKDFANNGVLVIDSETMKYQYISALDMALDNEDNIILSGFGSQELNGYYNHDVTGDTFLYKYNPQGELDYQFGEQGIIMFSVGMKRHNLFLRTDEEGNIYASGNNLMRKYSPDGVLDSSFGSGGQINLEAYNPYQGGFIVDETNIFLLCEKGVLKLDHNGVIDSTFGNQGIAVYREIPNYKWIIGEAITLDPGKNIYVTGTAYNEVTGADIWVDKILPDGSYDNYSSLSRWPFMYVGEGLVEDEVDVCVSADISSDIIWSPFWGLLIAGGDYLNYYIFKFDTNGVKDSANSIGGEQQDLWNNGDTKLAFSQKGDLYIMSSSYPDLAGIFNNYSISLDKYKKEELLAPKNCPVRLEYNDAYGVALAVDSRGRILILGDSLLHKGMITKDLDVMLLRYLDITAVNN